MNFLNKFHIHKLIKTEKTESELADSLKTFRCKKMEIEKEKILISGKVFYDFVCDLNFPDVKLTAKPKKTILIVVLTFLIIWIIGFIFQYGILFGLTLTTMFVSFFVFVHKKMMELNLDELIKLIKQ